MKTSQFKVINLNKNFYMKSDDYLDHWAKKCGWKATLVYDSLCRHSDRHGEAFPSIKLMAEEHGVGRRTIMRGIKILEDFGIIKRKQTRNRGGKWLHNTYYLLDKKQWNDLTVVHNRHSVNRGTSQTHTVVHIGHTNQTNITKPIHSLGKFGSIKSLGENEFKEIAEKYLVSLPFVLSKCDDMENWCESKGKKYRNYYRALSMWVKKDAIDIRKEAQNGNSKRAIDARGIR